ncbi:family 43 glycosylhydrolase [Halobacterium noricense]|uniref:Family 43 glycosylhydrolase n=1 Tax=Haladaptatus pallidirubidus TaxID=1008152 RepID=A0AAV3UJS1_9EURY
MNWECVGEAFEKRPEWKEYGNIWAPDISKYRGTYYLYYSVSTWGGSNPGIGLATADSPEGPFEDRGKLFTLDEIGVENSIDPFFYRDGDTPYLFWGSFHGIYGVELTEAGFDVAGEPFQIAGDAFEAAHILRRDGAYYFFGSSGSCCEGMESTYRITVGRADSLNGPYTDGEGNHLLNQQGRLVVGGTEQFVAPGHNTVVTDDTGDDWLLYHAYEDPNYYHEGILRRALMTDKLVWSDDFLHVSERNPSKEVPVPTVE